jgi:hypothetical protein
MLNLIAYNLIPVPKVVPARPAKLPRTIDRITRATPTREKPMLFPANYNFKAAVVDVAKLVDRPWCAPSGIDLRCSLRCRTAFFQQTARQTEGLPTRHKRDRACACNRAQGSGLAFLSLRWLDRANCLLKLTPKIAFSRRAWQ